ncbi:hypothetical protein TEA_013984 [Camellia sinensis var. sinensis]|uniref:non-specific serine/threonine protein kinase n=1 Tax=Camellia sinensis var. sinensis TaxID=542762 RepID=A0A4S4ERV7_CAMSN|nr:hypothetical protein TEA_013984 [Camellia sinensis var. sinensis]
MPLLIYVLDTTKSNSLEWRKRFDIIVGIARGLLYLHRDSRLRIIHRVLKASNVLLDNEMNPKISDFGIARAFGGDQISEKTRRVIGTYGYMSPEYILRGLFSMKSDVFSFRVLVLEIVSGQRNRKFRHPNHTHNLLGHAWKLWLEGNAIKLVEEKLETSTMLMLEVIKCIQIGLLCVQQRPEDRPTMSSVVSMLDNEGAMLPHPKQPGFYTEGSSNETELALTTGIKCSTNKATLTILLALTLDNQRTVEEDLELPLFDLVTISNATDNFSFANKIRESGFGPVYKSVLPTGQEIAVKRLSKTSGQGLTEFKNKVILIAKMQHRNLVRLLGCCIHEEERMLAYEYMANKSLDLLSFARSFGGDQSEENTNRVIGTYGYMSPEYAIDGHFSVKSDVFIFGVLVLETVSGKKNRGFYHPDHDLNLLGHAWKLWNKGKSMKLVDALMESLIPTLEVLRYDMLNQYQQINDSGALVSARGDFKLGFFSTSNSRRRYLGIWYNNLPVQTIVWVANRDRPLNDSSGGLKIGDDGNLILLDSGGIVAWSTRIQNISSKPTVAQLLDSGNLVLRSENGGNTESYIWQSFDHPSDTLIAGMKLGWDLRVGLNRYLTSWKSADDPSPGDISYRFDLDGLPQGVIRKGSVKKYRTGIWNGLQFNGAVLENSVFKANFIDNSEEVYFEFDLYQQLIRLVLNPTGTKQCVIWNNRNSEWVDISTEPSDPCERYGHCGPNSICTISNAYICSCLNGYIPKSSQDWNALVWDGGCIPKYPLNCSDGEGFVAFEGVIVPDMLDFWMNTSMTVKECELECLKNCSCTAYANSDTSGGGSGCLLWYGDLFDIRSFPNPGDQTLYIRVTAADLVSRSDSKEKKKRPMLVIIPISVALLFLLASCIIWKRIKQTRGSRPKIPLKDDENIDLPIFNIVTIANATNNFSISNKIGEGGFGPVYKCRFAFGGPMSVYVAFTLDILFGECPYTTKSNSLEWRKRFDIIVGIARGLLYLHRDSRLRIIHRDLKASNVLLDNEMNPKISDFGIARAFGGDQISEKTRRVIGTYGYMSPEYILRGIFSMKSDVFSFGVLVLEIVSGRRNRKFQHPNHIHNLLGHAWKLWIEGNAIKLVDEKLETLTMLMSEAIKCIQIGLLCVQQRPEDRPTMSSVVSMLDNEGAMLPRPKQPGFYTEGSNDETELASTTGIKCSTNKTTLTILLVPASIGRGRRSWVPDQSWMVGRRQGRSSANQWPETAGVWVPASLGRSRRSWVPDRSWVVGRRQGRSSANQWPETAGVWVLKSEEHRKLDGMLNQYQQINDSGGLQTIIWVANRHRPLNDSSGGLKIGDDGNLILLDSGGIVAWSTESYIWQSFDHPSDTLIAGMKLGWDLRVGLDRYLTSWKSADDPSPGDISYRFDLDGLPQGVIRKGSVKQYRTGIWNGLQFNGVEPQNSIFNSNFIDNSEENNRNLEWFVINTVPSNPCERHGQCGPNSICTISNAFICSCLDGYIPKSSQDWNTMVWNGGCVRKFPSNCSDGQGFLAFKGMIVPDLLEFSLNTRASGCLLWYGDLIDFKRFANPGDQTLYIRVTAADLESRSDSKEKKKKLLLVIIPVSVALLSFLLASCVMWKRIKQTRGSRPNIPFKDDENIDIPIFNIVTITNATNNFSEKVGSD